MGAKYYLDEYKGWYLTATLLERAADGPGNSFVSNGGDYATEAVRNHPGFRSAVNDLIWATAGSYGSLYVDSWGSYEFKLSDGDLGAALHKTSFHVKGYKDESGRWQVYVSVYDVFDFTEFKNPFMSGNTAKETLLWVANDAAYVDMMLGMLDEVTVEINMFDTY